MSCNGAQFWQLSSYCPHIVQGLVANKQGIKKGNNKQEITRQMSKSPQKLDPSSTYWLSHRFGSSGTFMLAASKQHQQHYHDRRGQQHQKHQHRHQQQHHHEHQDHLHPSRSSSTTTTTTTMTTAPPPHANAIAERCRQSFFRFFLLPLLLQVTL